MEHEASLAEPPNTPPRKRRRYSAAFKAQVIAECEQPDTSVAGVAIRHSLNPNLVQKWRLAQRRDQQDGFLRLPAPAPPVSEAATHSDSTTVRIEVPTPSGQLIVHWPMTQLKQSVAWLRALTK